jgi:hypothetical protein
MRNLAIIVAAGALLVASPGAETKPPPGNAKGEADLAKLLSGRTQGAPEHCIDASPASSSDNARIIDGTAIVYDEGRTLYVNRPRGNLETLHENDTLVSEVWGSQHCSLDRVRTIEPGSGFPHSFLILGEFVPYTKPGK